MNATRVVVRAMTMEDVPAVLAVEEQCFPRPWKAHQFHQELRELLVPLAEAFGDRERARRAARSLWPAVQGGLRAAALQAAVTFDDGRLRVTYATTLVGCAWLALAVLLDESHGLVGRLGRCGACGRFNVAFTGKPRRHCSEDHLDQYRAMTSTARVARWRERQRPRPARARAATTRQVPAESLRECVAGGRQGAAYRRQCAPHQLLRPREADPPHDPRIHCAAA